MRTLRRLGFVALVLGFAQVVFGAIVRITGSGMGCGDHWPKCNGVWFPPLDNAELFIEITHRWIAAGLLIAILALLVAAYAQRDELGIAGRGGVLRVALGAAVLWLAPGTWRRSPQSPGRDRAVPTDWEVVARRWEEPGTLILVRPNVAHAVWLFWRPDGRLRSWYVNLQKPVRRTRSGFDSMDQALAAALRRKPAALRVVPGEVVDADEPLKDKPAVPDKVIRGSFPPSEQPPAVVAPREGGRKTLR